MEKQHENGTAVAVPFHGDEVLAARVEGVVQVPIKRLCENLGLHLETQHKRLKEDPRFNYTLIRITGPDGKKYKMGCLPVDQTNGWLFTVNANRVREDLKEKLIWYQRECVRVLNERFTGGKFTERNFAPSENQARQIAEGPSVEKMADILMENRDLKKDLEMLRAENARLNDVKYQPYREEVNKLAETVKHRDYEILGLKEDLNEAWGKSIDLEKRNKQLENLVAGLSARSQEQQERIEAWERQDPDKRGLLDQLHEAHADLKFFIKDSSELRQANDSLRRRLDEEKKRTVDLKGKVERLTLQVKELLERQEGGTSHD